MALALTQIQAVTDDYWEKTPVDIYFTENVLLYLLMGGGGMEANFVTPGELVDGGDNIRVILEYAGVNSGAYGATTNISVVKNTILGAARFRWAAYYSSDTIDFDDKRKNTGEAAKVDLIQAKLKSMEKTIRDLMGSEVYSSATDANCFLGLGNLFNTTTSTAYGNVAEDDMASWAANAITGAKTMSYTFMQELRREASVGQSKKAKPNLYITTEVLYDAFDATLQPQKRYTDDDLADAGFENVKFKQGAVVADDNQSSGYVDALNTNFLSIKTHKDFAFTKPIWEHTKDQPDTETANIRWSGQLVCKHRNAQARANNVSAAA